MRKSWAADGETKSTDFPLEASYMGQKWLTGKYPCCAHSWARSSLKLAVLDSL